MKTLIALTYQHLQEVICLFDLADVDALELNNVGHSSDTYLVHLIEPIEHEVFLAVR